MMFSAHDTATPSSRTPRRWGSAVVLLCLVLFLAAMVPATVAEAKVPKGFFGIAPGVTHLDSKDYKKMGKTKVKTFRASVSWKGVEPQQGVYHWGGVDSQVAALAKNGITPILMIWGAPQWATGSGYPGVPPLKPNAARPGRRS